MGIFIIIIVLYSVIAANSNIALCNQLSNLQSQLKTWQMVPDEKLVIYHHQLERPTGIIESPNYPHAYPEDIDSYVIIELNGFQPTRIRLQFLDLDIESSDTCRHDYLVIRPIDELEDATSYVTCGTILPQPIMIPIGRSVNLSFHSDDFSFGQRGFKLMYEFLSENSTLFTGCHPDEYLCKNRRCVNKKLLCNHVDDCGDGSDEDSSAECKNLPSIPYRTDYECGLSYFEPNVRRETLQPRIVGGENAIKWSWPSQVDIEFMRVEPLSHNCGGVLIHPMYVLSAAHCLTYRVYPIQLKFGAHNLLDSIKDSSQDGTNPVQIRYAASIDIFPGDSEAEKYSRSFKKSDLHNDIALIRLNAPVKLAKNVWPACLPNLNEPLNSNRVCYATGWGTTRGTGSSYVLKQVKQTITHETECKSEFSNAGLHYHDYSQICVKATEPEGVCIGDSGSPLFCEDIVAPTNKYKLSSRDERSKTFLNNSKYLDIPIGMQISENHNSRWTVHGLTSTATCSEYAMHYCAIVNSLTFYSRVSTKVDWIISQMILKSEALSSEDKKDPDFPYLFRNKNMRSIGKEKLYMTIL